VLVSEVMLQQTQALRVVPRWAEFVGVFPTPTACAEASLGDVLRLWHGLGYPRRARDLHQAAIVVTRRHGGRLPSSLEELLALPGVGPYTARAVLAFAFEADAAVVDTNIARVLARVEGRRLTAREAQAVADAWSVPTSSWAWNQSLMDLGATLCRPASPRCPECPLRTTCRWHLDGHPDPDPACGSAGVSVRQARFEGSDRQARGRLMKALTRGAVPAVDAPNVMARRPEAATTLVRALVAEGLIVADGELLRLP
jgi:A/G-specific adenine glycosylase